MNDWAQLRMSGRKRRGVTFGLWGTLDMSRTKVKRERYERVTTPHEDAKEPCGSQSAGTIYRGAPEIRPEQSGEGIRS